MKNILYLMIVVLISSCGGNDDENISQAELDKARAIADYNPIILERNGIKLVEFTDYPPFSDVSAEIAVKNQTIKLGTNKIEFKTQFFNMGEKTAEEGAHSLRLNEGGQYLGVIKPDNSLSKVIQNHFDTEVEAGDNYYLCYLSRSYDLSLKNPNAAFLFKINADQNGAFSETNLSDTVIAVLQPRGEFTYSDNQNILLDFYLINISIGENGNYASISIDGTVFKLTKWTPFLIKGLKVGKHQIKLSVKDKNGNDVKSLMPNQLEQNFVINEVSLFE